MGLLVVVGRNWQLSEAPQLRKGFLDLGDPVPEQFNLLAPALRLGEQPPCHGARECRVVGGDPRSQRIARRCREGGERVEKRFEMLCIAFGSRRERVQVRARVQAADRAGGPFGMYTVGCTCLDIAE